MGLLDWVRKKNYEVCCNEADRCFDEYIKNYDKWISTHLDKYFLKALNSSKKSERTFSKAINLDKDKPYAYARLASLYDSVGELQYIHLNDEKTKIELYKAAVKLLDRAIKLTNDPKEKAELHYQKSRNLGGLGLKKQSAEARRMADTLVPGFTKKNLERNIEIMEKTIEEFKSQKK